MIITNKDLEWATEFFHHGILEKLEKWETKTK